jgi:hypothetical protein
MPAPEGADNRRTMPAPEGAALLAPEGVDDEEEPPPFKDANYDSDDDSDDDDDGDAPLRYPVRTTRNADPKYGPKFRDRVNYASLKTGDAFIACGLNFDSPPKSHQCKMFALLAKELTEIDTGILDYHHPLAFSAKANDEDTPTYRQAMSGPDCDGYLDAMELEMAQLRAKKTWTVVPRTEALALGANIIRSTWVLKRKRYNTVNWRPKSRATVTLIKSFSYLISLRPLIIFKPPFSSKAMADFTRVRPYCNPKEKVQPTIGTYGNVQ